MQERLGPGLWLAAIALTLGGAVGAEAAGPETEEPHERIRHAAEAHMQQMLEGQDRRVEAAAEPLDARLHLPACASELATDLPYGDASGSRVTVAVSCAEPRAWRIFVPVRLNVYAPVVVAAHALPRNAILTPADLELAEREINQPNRGFIDRIEQASGHKLRRALEAGTPVSPQQIESPPAIKRGQAVTLTAKTSGLSVAMRGTAMRDGALGQIIDVRNESSQRLVQAIVRSERTVEVVLQ